MLKQSTRLFVFAAILIAMLALSSSSGPGLWQGNQALAEAGKPQPNLELLAAATGHSAENLQNLEETTEKLLNGTQILRLKGLDQATGEVIGASFQDGKPVDYSQARAQAGKEWRAAHGALTPQLVTKLAAMQPEERINISIWLAGDIQALPHPEHIYSEQASSSTAGGDTSAASSEPAARTTSESKQPEIPLSDDQIPAEVREAAGMQSAASAPDAPVEKGQDEVNAKTFSHSADTAATLESAEAFNKQNEVYLQTQVSSLKAHFLDLMSVRGLAVEYSSDIVPAAYLSGLTRQQVEDLAQLPEIDSIYWVPDQAGPSLSVARPSQNANLINNVGYNGTGVSVSVTEGERIFFANPRLSVNGSYDGTQLYANHPTAVGGIIKSIDATFHGLASGVSLYSGNGSYTNWATMSSAMDWGSTNAKVLNNSWYWDDPNSSVFWEADRHQDYFVRYRYDFVAVAAGNFGNGCGSNFSSYVVSPAKGYNVMTVGNYDDNNTLGWSDDSMDVCSSFGNPAADTAGLIHEKPEVAAIGHEISSTLVATVAPYIGNVGSGTSYASPMVAALAADIIEASPVLTNEPEAVKAIIMATALHNVEGSIRLSDKDGVGGIDASAALATVERGNFDDRSISTATTFPIQFTQFAYKGERVRFVINWLSNPAADYTTDVLPADLDLTAYRADGTTIIQSSMSSNNPFEIVDFVAPASETYIFRISRFSYSGGNTWLGSAWWRGTYRISPEVGYSDPKAMPLGTHLTVIPTDWDPTNYWRVMGIRPTASDHDLLLYSRSWFDDPGQRSYINSSGFLTNTVDLITVDGNHWPSGNEEQYVVTPYTGSGGYNVSWSNQGRALVYPGWYGPYSMGSAEVGKIFDLYFFANRAREIQIVPTTANATDLAVRLYKSAIGDSSTYAQRLSQSAAFGDASTLVTATERLFYTNSSLGDWTGLVVYSKQAASGEFYIFVKDYLFLPVIRKK